MRIGKRRRIKKHISTNQKTGTVSTFKGWTRRINGKIYWFSAFKLVNEPAGVKSTKVTVFHIVSDTPCILKTFHFHNLPVDKT